MQSVNSQAEPLRPDIGSDGGYSFGASGFGFGGVFFFGAAGRLGAAFALGRAEDFAEADFEGALAVRDVESALGFLLCTTGSAVLGSAAAVFGSPRRFSPAFIRVSPMFSANRRFFFRM